MKRHAKRATLLCLITIAAGLMGCSHEEAPKPRPVANNPMHIPAEEYNKIQNMSPQQRAMIQAQLERAHPGQGAPTTTPPNSGQ